jgi:hypothetical protein
MWRLDVSAAAELDIFEAALRYERERADLGFHFESLLHLHRHPDTGKRRHGDTE